MFGMTKSFSRNFFTRKSLDDVRLLDHVLPQEHFLSEGKMKWLALTYGWNLEVILLMTISAFNVNNFFQPAFRHYYLSLVLKSFIRKPPI